MPVPRREGKGIGEPESPRLLSNLAWKENPSSLVKGGKADFVLMFLPSSFIPSPLFFILTEGQGTQAISESINNNPFIPNHVSCQGLASHLTSALSLSP